MAAPSTELETTTDCCPGCREPLAAGASVTCPTCRTPHHRACLTGEATCGTCGAPGYLVDTLTDSVQRSPWGWWLLAGVVLVFAASVTLALGAGVPPQMVLGISVVLAALTFDYVNGMHDAGNAIATVISTRVLSPVAALTMAALLNLAGALFHSGLAHSIATKFVNMDQVRPESITLMMILCGLVGASGWSYLTARWGLPVSTSHSLFGGLIGVFLLGGIPLNMQYLGKIGLFMVLAPLTAFSVGWLLMVGLMWLFRNWTPHVINKFFRVLQVGSAASMAFAHGSNDAQKAMGIITLALFTGGFLGHGNVDHLDIPLWVKVACAVVIALGTAFGGMRVIKTLGHKIIKLDPIHGFAAETVAALTIQLVTILKVPISTTHVISSSILGIGASKRLSAVRWGVAANIVVAWVFTIPTCALAGALLYALVRWATGIQ